MDHGALVIILSTGGSPLDRTVLDALDGVTVTWLRVEREGDAACLAARVRHTDRPEDFQPRIRGWGAARGWSITVAPDRWPR